ncbi:MAG: mucoidy inhibitor MuiA family protein [Prochloraceae cyanobacterium]|nr:mucoidy inhibitor MuiA family protein [Prochloraceae cyanobacterium]
MTVTISKLTINAPISVVTVLEDRALVRRKATINLTSGLWRVKIEKTTPLLWDKSLRAEFVKSSENNIINDVRSRRQMLVKETEKPEKIKQFLAEYRKFVNNFEIKTEERQHGETSFIGLKEILNKTIIEIPIDAVWGQLDLSSWCSQLNSLWQRMRDLQNEIVSNYYEQEKLAEQINYLIERIEAIARPDYVYTADIEADLTINQPGEYEIIFEYIVANALWRPWHQAHLIKEENASVNFRCDGCVWQNTGENWENVDLILSTARPSLGTEPPLLNDDLLNIKNKSEQIIVKVREQIIQTTGIKPEQTSTTVNLPGVDDGGEVRILRAIKKANIPSDGHPYRVPLFEWQSPAKIEYLLMPEIAPQVILKSEQINRSNYPLLAAPVDLISNSEFIGKTSILFIAPQEKFALGWGADPGIRVQREKNWQKKEGNLINWDVYIFKIEIFLSNIGDRNRKIKIVERIPISELEQVKIKIIEETTTNQIQPDENGFCTWNVISNAYSQQQIDLVYQIQAASEVKLDEYF